MAKDKRSWKQLHINSMKLVYGGLVKKYENCLDDRRIYANTYKMIMEALESLPENPHLLVRIAVAEQIRKEQMEMDRIKAHFENK